MKVVIDEAKKKVELHLTKSSDFDSSILLKAFPFSGYKIKPSSGDIDLKLRPLIREMHDNNYRTFLCCSGHGEKIGYVLFLPPKKRELRVATWQLNEPTPQKISDLRKITKSSITIDEGNDAIKLWLSKLIVKTGVLQEVVTCECPKKES